MWDLEMGKEGTQYSVLTSYSRIRLLFKSLISLFCQIAPLSSAAAVLIQDMCKDVCRYDETIFQQAVQIKIKKRPAVLKKQFQVWLKWHYRLINSTVVTIRWLHENKYLS